MSQTVFFLGSHPALSAAELWAYGERTGRLPAWDLSRLPVALLGSGVLPSPSVQPQLGGTTMIGTLRETFSAFPDPEAVLSNVPELRTEHQGKRVIGVSALPCPAEPGLASGDVAELAAQVRHFALALKASVGRKGTRVVFPPAKRSDLSTAQLLHNRLPKHGTALCFLVAPGRVDLVTIETIQDIEAYAQRDRGRPQADPGHGMLPPKVAQMLVNLSLVPPDGTVYDPFCGVGTIPMEAVLLGCNSMASDVSPKQVQRTRENLEWLRQYVPSGRPPGSPVRLFVHDVTKGAFPLDPGSVDAIVTEGWLGPARTSSPSPKQTEAAFQKVGALLARLLQSAKAVLKPGGRVVVTLPVFRLKKRLLSFPLETLRLAGYALEPLVPDPWRAHPLFRGSTRGTLVYGRPDAFVLREVVRMRRVR